MFLTTHLCPVLCKQTRIRVFLTTHQCPVLCLQTNTHQSVCVSLACVMVLHINHFCFLIQFGNIQKREIERERLHAHTHTTHWHTHTLKSIINKSAGKALACIAYHCCKRTRSLAAGYGVAALHSTRARHFRWPQNSWFMLTLFSSSVVYSHTFMPQTQHRNRTGPRPSLLVLSVSVSVE